MRGDTEITNSEDIIDSRDVIQRIDYLQDERATLEDARDQAAEELNAHTDAEDEGEYATKLGDAENELIEWDESDEGRELKALLALQEEAEGYSEDWRHGATLIRDSYFTEYAKECAGDFADYNPRDVKWPFTCIDWEKAADEMKQDYTEVDFDGTAYWVR